MIKKNNLSSVYKNLEKEFEVIYPENTNATYSSILNFSDDLLKPYQRWYRYKEGYSIELVNKLFEEYCNNKNAIILDPFLGSGTTLLAARYAGYDGIGFETNPFSFFLSKCKLKIYDNKTITEYEIEYKRILNNTNEERVYYLPNLSISKKVFNKEIEKYLMNLYCSINDVKNDDVKNLLKIGWLSVIEEFSNYRKAGNGLKIRKYVKPRSVSVENVKEKLLLEYKNIAEDIKLKSNKTKNNIENISCLDGIKKIDDCSIDGVIYSPPYANCFDYTEIYKLELWFGHFVENYKDLKALRNNAIRSNLNGLLENECTYNMDELNYLCSELKKKELWDKRIPNMLYSYYSDLFLLLDETYRVLKKDGFSCIVVGNSTYGDIVFPADLILAKYAKSIGFIVDKIEVYRYIITSSQQYESTKNNGKYIRESVVCLKKM